MANTFKNAVANDVGTSYASVYAAPAATTTVVLGVALCNKTTSTITGNIRMNIGGTFTNVLQNVEIPSGTTLEVLSGQKYVLEETHGLEVSSSVAAGLDVTMGIMEVS